MQQGDIGANITITVQDDDGDPIDLTNATDLVLYAKPPSRTVKQFTPALLDGPAGQIRYTTVSADDFDEPGRWQVQAAYSLAGFVGRTEIFDVEVGRNLS